MHAQYDYLILGGGVAADSAARGIREIEHERSPEDSTTPPATIGILSADVEPPYDRPPLSKGLWTDPAVTDSSIDLHTAADTEASILTGKRVIRLEPSAHAVATADGDTFSYGDVLIATGGTPRTLPGLPASDKVVYYRSHADYQHVRSHVNDLSRVVVVGGGFIATEVAASLAVNGVHVSLVYPEAVLGERVFPSDLAHAIERRYADEGVELHAGHQVASAVETADLETLTLDDGSTVAGDLVVLGLGVVPAIDFLDDSGIEVANGIVVDEHLRASAPNVWAAGDIIDYPDSRLGRRRVEHVDQAEHSGKQAGRNMAGEFAPYTYTPFFWSDLFDQGYEAAGTLNASLTVVEDWTVPLKEGTLFYLDADRIPVGILTWNSYGFMQDALRILAEKAPIDPDHPVKLKAD